MGSVVGGACVLSRFSRVQLLVTPWTVASQAPPWDSPGKNAGVGFRFFLQGSSQPRDRTPHPLGLLHWQASSLLPVPPGKPTALSYFMNENETDEYLSPH